MNGYFSHIVQRAGVAASDSPMLSHTHEQPIENQAFHDPFANPLIITQADDMVKDFNSKDKVDPVLGKSGTTGDGAGITGEVDNKQFPGTTTIDPQTKFIEKEIIKHVSIPPSLEPDGQEKSFDDIGEVKSTPVVSTNFVSAISHKTDHQNEAFKSDTIRPAETVHDKKENTQLLKEKIIVEKEIRQRQKLQTIEKPPLFKSADKPLPGRSETASGKASKLVIGKITVQVIQSAKQQVTVKTVDRVAPVAPKPPAGINHKLLFGLGQF